MNKFADMPGGARRFFGDGSTVLTWEYVNPDLIKVILDDCQFRLVRHYPHGWDIAASY